MATNHAQFLTSYANKACINCYFPPFKTLSTQNTNTCADSTMPVWTLLFLCTLYSYYLFTIIGVIEGDIVYDENFKILTGRIAPRGRRDTLSDQMFHWVNAVIPYEIANDMCKYYTQQKHHRLAINFMITGWLQLINDNN